MRYQNKARPGEREAWAVNIGCIDPEDMRALEASTELLKYAEDNLSGYCGVHPNLPYGVFLIFNTRENAIAGKAAIERIGVQTYGAPRQCFIPAGYRR